MTIVSVTTLLPVSVPDNERVIQAKVTSDIYEGITIEIPNLEGTSFYSLHDLFASGLVEGISFNYKAAEKAE